MKISIKHLDPDQSKKLLQIIWQVLNETSQDLQNEPENCGMTLDNLIHYYTAPGEFGKQQHTRIVRRIIRLAYAEGMSFTSDSLKRLILFGDGDCLGCGSNDISYDNDWAVCNCCGHNWPVTVPLYSSEW